MRTLREIGVFVGIPEDSPEFGSLSPIGLLNAGALLAPVSFAGEERSLRGLSSLLETLSPITLNAALLTAGGVEPFQPVIRVQPSQGLVISTYIQFSLSGDVLFQSQNYGAAGGDFKPTQLSPGQWTIVVRRSGIGNGGYVRLQQSFQASVSPIPAPPPPPPQVTRPHIDVLESGPANATKYVVTGSGFLPNQPPDQNGITVRAVDGVDIQNWVMVFTGSNAGGAINLTLGPLDTTLLPRNAAGQSIVNFSATDKRRDPSSVPANEPLWSNVVPFRYA